MPFPISRRELLKMGGAVPLAGLTRGLLEVGAPPAAAAEEIRPFERLIPISLAGARGLKNPDGDLVLRPDAEITFDADAPPNLEARAWSLRLIGQVDFDPATRTPYDFQKFLDLIDDALDPHTTHHQAYSLKLEGRGEPRTQAAYMRVVWEFGAPPETYPFTIWAKQERLQLLPGGRFGVEVEVFLKNAARRADDITGRPDRRHFLNLESAGPEWRQHTMPIPVDDTVACLLFRIVAEKYRGTVWLENPRFYEAPGRSSLPPFAPGKPFEPYRAWLGVNLSRKEWPEFEVRVNGREAFKGLRFQPEYIWPRTELPIPSGLLRPGTNSIGLALKKNCQGQHPYLLREAQWLGVPSGRIEVLVAPTLVDAGKEFGIAVRTREADVEARVDAMAHRTGGIEPVAASVTLPKPGLHFIKFRAGQAGPGATVRIRVGAEERRADIDRVVERPEDDVLVGSGDSQWFAFNKESLQQFFEWHLHNSVGNFILLRPIYYEGAGTRFYDPDAWRYVVETCEQAGIHYALLENQSELPEVDSNPTEDVLAGPLYLGAQEHELDGCYYYWNVQFRQPLKVYTGDCKNTFRLPELALHTDLFDRNPRRSRCPHPSDPRLATDTMLRYRWCGFHAVKDMKEGAEYFIENLKNVRPGGPRHSGPATSFKYFFQAGNYNYLIGEVMYGPFEVVLGALRGASLANSQPHYGAHIASQWSTTPHDDPAAFRRYFLALATCYLHGVREIYQEDCLSHIEYGFVADDRFSAACQGHLKVHQAFYRFTRAHSRRGRMRAPVGFLQGQYDAWNCWDNQVSVWGQSGPEWDVGAPEKSWELIKTFFPRSVLSPIYRNPCPHEPVGFYTGTPYGPADIVPIEVDSEHFATYDTLALLGWNTADRAQLRRLVNYVENGGRLMLGLVHLSIEVRRNRPPQPLASHEVRELLGLDIVGLALSSGNYKNAGNAARNLASLIGPGELQLGRVELRGAAPLVTDSAGAPVLIENKIGRGSVLFLNAAVYPGEERVAPLWVSLLHHAGAASAERERQRGWVRGNEDVSFAAWDWDRRNSKSPIRSIYLLNVKWWNMEPAEARLLWGPAEIPLSVPWGHLHVMTLSGDWGIWAQDGETDVIGIEPQMRSARIRIQGQGRTRLLVLYRPSGSRQPVLRGITNQRPLCVEPLSTPGLWRTEIDLNGPADLRFEV